MDFAESNEKSPSAPQSHAPPYTADTTKLPSPTPQKQSKFDKLWHGMHICAMACSALVIVSSACLYFTSNIHDCDNYSPYSRALLSGLTAMGLSAFAYLYAYHLRETSRTLEVSNSWSPRARQRRRERIPLFFAITAADQCLAALALGTAAYRTSRAPLGLGVANVLAALGMTMCLIAGICNMWLAYSARQSKWMNQAHIDALGEKNTQQEKGFESTLLYDKDFASLPSFDKQWLAAHVFALAAIISAQVTLMVFLGQLSCADSSRKPLMKLSEDTFTITVQILNMGQFIFKLWLPRVDGRAQGKDQSQSRLTAIFAQVCLLAVFSCLGIAAYTAPHSSYSLIVAKLQTAVASLACLVCSGYNFALMLKTNFNAPPTDVAAVEKNAQTASEEAVL